MFGDHTPASTKERGSVGAMQAFSRGTLVGGRQWTFKFDNGFGASVINDGYGSESGLYELGVLHGGHLTYDTPLTDDVLGYLTAEDVTAALDKIEALTADVVLAEVARRADAERDERIAALRKELAALEGEAKA